MVTIQTGARIALIAATTLFAFTTAGQAATAASCRAYAEAAAADWSAGRITPTDQITMPEPGELIVISYGRKYIMPLNRPGDGNVYPTAVGELARERNEVYREEYERCRSGKGITIRIEDATQ